MTSSTITARQFREVEILFIRNPFMTIAEREVEAGRMGLSRKHQLDVNYNRRYCDGGLLRETEHARQLARYIKTQLAQKRIQDEAKRIYKDEMAKVPYGYYPTIYLALGVIYQKVTHLNPYPLPPPEPLPLIPGVLPAPWNLDEDLLPPAYQTNHHPIQHWEKFLL